MGSTLLAAAFLTSCLLAGGFYESTYSLLAAAIWLGLAVAGSLAQLRRPSAAVWALAALALWTALSALWGPAGPALRVVPLAALYAGVLLAAEQVDRRLLLRLAWGVCVLVAAVALTTAALGLAPAAPGPDSSRLAWPIGYPNGLGLVAATGVLLSFLLPSRAALPGGVVCAAALALTFSRTAILAGLVGLVVLAALRGRIPRPAAVAGALTLAILAAALAQPLAARFAAPAPDERDARRLLDVTGHGRTDLWRSAWEQGLDQPLAGAGGGTWARGYVEETDGSLRPRTRTRSRSRRSRSSGSWGSRCSHRFSSSSPTAPGASRLRPPSSLRGRSRRPPTGSGSSPRPRSRCSSPPLR